MTPLATDKWGNPLMPISVKGIVIENGRVWLRKNEHGRWELPGGRPENGEQPEQTVVREIAEELGLDVTPTAIADVYLWKKDFGSNPLICIVTFLCETGARVGELEIEGEGGAAEFQRMSLAEVLELADLPEVYKRPLRKIREKETTHARR